VLKTSVLTRLGSIPVAQFMREFWQRKPLLVRAALPGFRPPVGRDRLFQYARRDDVESRLVTHFNDRWSLSPGPLSRLPSTRRDRWTLLVQGVDLLDENASALLARFRFVPDARLDDLMVSYATDQGGVGPHVDSYDVFLLQAAGRRRWRVSRQQQVDTVPGAPLKILARFRADEEWVLEPGDMLYLPPGVAHEGTAIGESLTYSIGFRAPTFKELFEPWLIDFADTVSLPGRYADPGRAAARCPARLPSDMVADIHASLSSARPRPRDTEHFLLRYLTEPKASTVFDRPRRTASFQQFMRSAARRGVALDGRTRMIYTRTMVGINGEALAVPRDCVSTVRTLADKRGLSPEQATDVTDIGRKLMHDWYTAGWLHPGAGASQ
jgi:50S ribosomal protein L16 3-hydroxylase